MVMLVGIRAARGPAYTQHMRAPSWSGIYAGIYQSLQSSPFPSPFDIV